MSVSWADDDERLGAELQAAGREVDAVPPEFAAAARAAFTWRTVDAELLELAEDAALAGLPAVRGAETAERRVLEFRGTHLSITIELSPEHAEGQVLPAGSYPLTKADLDGTTVEVEVDDSGFFGFSVSVQESFRLQLEVDGSAYVTPWVTA
jgi:hypothetical protein